jgi:hypothetical protein
VLENHGTGIAGGLVGYWAANAAPAGELGGGMIWIPHIHSNFYKVFLSYNQISEYDSSTSSPNMGVIVSTWKSTAPIEKITFKSANNANLLAGSLISIYGLM